MDATSTGRSRIAPAGSILRYALADDHLAGMAAAGDQHAFATIYERHHRGLYRYCLAVLGDPDEAEDAMQSTMVSALGSLPGEKRSISLKPWLYRVAYNEAITILRLRRSGPEVDRSLEVAGPSALDQLEDRLRFRQLVTDLRSLPERQRGALIMRELSGLSYDEIAIALETSAASAKQAAYQARIALAELMEGRTMNCDAARRALSAGDGRVLRGRKASAHLRECPECRAFRATIDQRTAEPGHRDRRVGGSIPPPASLKALHLTA